MIALDASVLIAHLDESDAHHLAADRQLDEAVDSFVVGGLTLAEVMVGAQRAGRSEPTRQAIARMRVHVVSVAEEWGSILSLATLRGETRLPLPDCCVLQVAQSTGADTLLTFDRRLAKVARGRGLTVPS